MTLTSDTAHVTPQIDERVVLREENAFLRSELDRYRQELARFTNDTCYGRCDSPDGFRDWFTWETRGLLVPEAHVVLDLVLNKIASDKAVGR